VLVDVIKFGVNDDKLLDLIDIILVMHYLNERID
jgi:hypothetical protein